MKSLNKVFLMGHLGADPQIKISKNGRPYARLSVATNQHWQNEQDEWEEKTEWHSVFVWGQLADRCCHNMKKGALVFVEGALTYWKVAEQKEYKNAIHGFDVRFMNKDPKALSAPIGEDLDNPEASRNHNAVAHPA